VEHNKFKSYLQTYGEKIPDDKSTCNNHDAIKSASSRGGKGTAVSGLGTIECSRHDMKRPIAVGDLQKGERYETFLFWTLFSYLLRRYVNMDYFFLSSLLVIQLFRIVVSYDIIACQWFKNL